MKNIYIYLSVLSIIFISCKKSDVIPDVIQINISNEIWRYDNYKKASNLDSVKYQVVQIDDTTKIIAGFTGNNGIIKLSLPKNTQYIISVVTPTYYSGLITSDHFYYSKSRTFWTSKESKNGENIIQPDFIIYHHYPYKGIGCTNIPVPEPTN